ncbi:HutD family protein [Peptoniphilus sp. oral taxon 386]|uniref:HutD family protein n=1 Tax=Peptoniphilus sp. oral taxon 386 TaxID=652713 RepID=UPI0001DA9A36|nr:HutD family protein [Peptoniphilus sp. oral taxon 386]EFI41872.1 hypothetical protein HMPREF0629_00501 [Peptoniphilus sp. oral taxon 386 str. F0131]
MKKILKEEFKTTNWSGGTTSQLFISPEDADVSKKDFDFRISSATCDLDESIFTPYNDYMRYITPLDGNLKLINNGADINIEPYEIYYFDGSDSVAGYSKVRDFNLIIKKGIDGKMYSIDVKNEVEIVGTSEVTIVFNYDGNLFAEGDKFSAFSAISLDNGEKVNVSGSGRILICEVK